VRAFLIVSSSIIGTLVIFGLGFFIAIQPKRPSSRALDGQSVSYLNRCIEEIFQNRQQLLERNPISCSDIVGDSNDILTSNLKLEENRQFKVQVQSKTERWFHFSSENPGVQMGRF
jgi:hypothetical protein